MKKVKVVLVGSLIAILVLSFCACGASVEESAEPAEPITSDEIGQLYADPDSFEGREFTFTGKVFSVEKDGNSYGLQVWQDIENSNNNTIVYCGNIENAVKEDDYVKVSGTIGGEFTGENMLGGEVNGVVVQADSIKVIDAMEAIPANKTVKVNKKVTKGNVSVKLKKVDFTDTEARLYLKIKNSSSGEVSIYSNSSTVIQNGKQYESSWNMDYPELSDEIQAGAYTEGVIVFEKLKEKTFTFKIDGYDDDFNELKYEFKVKVK